MRRILELGKQKAYEKEPPNAWVFRVLGLDPVRCAGMELRLENKALSYGVVGTNLANGMCLEPNEHVRQAVESWIRFGQNPDDHARSVSIVIHNEDRTLFLLQRKDDKHPNELCRGRYSLFGGSPHAGESIEPAAIRELLEEIRLMDLAQILHHLVHIDDMKLASVQWPGFYVCSVFALNIPNALFPKFFQSIVAENDLSESTGALVARDYLQETLHQKETKHPGSYFVASHHLAIDRFLRS